MTHQTDILPVAARYTRSVHIARDFGTTPRALAGYQATPLVLQTLERICTGLHPDSSARAFSLVGVYGTGKSAFGLFLAHYLGSTPARRRALIATHAATNELARFTHDGPPLLPVLVSGNHRSLRHALLAALRDALTSLPAACQEPVRELDIALQDGESDPQEVADLFEHATTAVVAQRTEWIFQKEHQDACTYEPRHQARTKRTFVCTVSKGI